MGFGKFSLYFKSATMLIARDGMATIQYANFSSFKKDTRTKIMRFLKTASEQYMKRETKDYREVFKNLAMNILRRNG
jgi:hypothetical protein